MTWPWTETIELAAQQQRDIAELKEKLSTLMQQAEDLRIQMQALKTSSQPQDVELDSNWLTRRRILERQNAKKGSTNAD